MWNYLVENNFLNLRPRLPPSAAAPRQFFFFFLKNTFDAVFFGSCVASFNWFSSPRNDTQNVVAFYALANLAKKKSKPLFFGQYQESNISSHMSCRSLIMLEYSVKKMMGES